MLKTGDSVRFLNENESGIIVGFRGKDVALVQIEDGFEIPMPVIQLVLITSAKEPSEAILEESIKKTEHEDDKVEIIGKEAVYIALTPHNPIFADTFTLCLINNSLFQLAYTITVKNKQVWKGLHCGAMPIASFIDIASFTNKEIEQWEYLIVQVLFFKAGVYKMQIPLEKHISIKDKRLQQSHLLKLAPIVNLQSHLFEIADFKEPALLQYADYEPTFSASMLRNKAKSDKGLTYKNDEEKGALRVNPKNGYMEIDLHIEELMENYSGLNNGEIVQIQLKHCKKAVDIAIQRNVGKITLIHGVGNGTLKREVRALLQTYTGIQFYDAPMDKYGYGATEVQLR